LAGILLTLAVALAYWFGALDGLELRAYDLRFRLRGPLPPRPDILLVTIDQATVQALGRKPAAISRAEHARVIANLTRRGARLIVYDLDFSCPGPAAEAENDHALQQALADSGKVILARSVSQGDWVRPAEMFRQAGLAVDQAVDKWTEEGIPDQDGNLVILWSPKGPEVDGWRVFAAKQPITDPNSEGVTRLAEVPAAEHFLQVSGLEPGAVYHFLVLGYRSAALLAGEGAISEIEDPDDRVRRQPLLVTAPLDPEKVPTLSFAAALAATWPGEQPQECSTGPDEVCLQGQGKELRVPLEEGNFLINFIGPRDSFPKQSFSQVLSLGAGAGGKPDLAGKIVLVGNTHPTAHDEYPTPFGRSAPRLRDRGRAGTRSGCTSGLEIHANALQTLLEQSFIRGQAPRRVVGLTLALGVLLTVYFIFLRAFSLPGLLGLLAAGAGLSCLAQFLFETRQIWMVVTPLLLTVGLTFLGVLLVQTVGESREKRFIRGAFGMCLAPAVIEQLLENPDQLALGGEERELTALFSGVEGFSGVSEKLSPHDLVQLRNEYLTAMCEVIFSFEGTVAKFEGDAVTAFFGAPIQKPDHARRACLAALAMQKRNAELGRKWAAAGRPPLLTRIGLNTGPMVVGNLGSAQRLDYTVMGDGVNLASRLEGANRQYGSLVMISEFTRRQAAAAVEVRELDLLAVAGKKKPVRVYELLAAAGELDGPTGAAVPAFARGLQLYRGQQWDPAIEKFQEAIQARGQDPVSEAFIRRCREFQQHPPGPDWDGVWRLQLK
jgi:adenylate cyclase